MVQGFDVGYAYVSPLLLYESNDWIQTRPYLSSPLWTYAKPIFVLSCKGADTYRPEERVRLEDQSKQYIAQ